MDLCGGGGGREMAEKYLGIAETLLGKRDINGSKLFAERALEADPLIDGVDQILAVADVLLACQRRVNNKVDWYSVLQLPRPSPPAAPGEDSVALKRQYRRLALLLHPDRNKFPGADAASALVADAFAVLSNPAKKSLFDAELGISNSVAAKASPSPSSSAGTPGGEPFWTACTSCCHVHQYSREYVDRSLRCPSCRRPFVASELSSPPPIVPGTDMYYCTWGFFPMGFPGGPNFFSDCPGAPLDLNSEWKPFFSMFPSQVSMPMADGHLESPIGVEKVSVIEQQRVQSARNTKRVAHKSTVRGAKKRLWSNEGHEKGNSGVGMVSPDREQWDGTGTKVIDVDEEDFRGININEAVKGSTDGLEDNGGSVTFHIDVDATEEILGNLNNLPFLKDDEIPLRMP